MASEHVCSPVRLRRTRCETRHRGAAVMVALALTAAASTTHAQGPSAADKETARALMDQGDEKAEAGDFPGALRAYEGAHGIMQLPMTGVAVARMRERLGQWLEARDLALDVSRTEKKAGENPAYAKARVEAQELADRLADRIPSLQVTVRASGVADVSVTIDGVALPKAAISLPRKVNPGRHRVEASAPGFSTASTEVTVAERATVPVALTLYPAGTTSPTATGAAAPAPAAASGGFSPLVWVGFGAAAVGFAVGGVTGAISWSEASAISDACPGGACPRSQDDAISTANTLANVSNVAFAVGLLGAGLGVVGLVIGGSSSTAKTGAARGGSIASLSIAPTGLRLRSQF